MPAGFLTFLCRFLLETLVKPYWHSHDLSLAAADGATLHASCGVIMGYYFGCVLDQMMLLKALVHITFSISSQACIESSVAASDRCFLTGFTMTWGF